MDEKIQENGNGNGEFRNGYPVRPEQFELSNIEANVILPSMLAAYVAVETNAGYRNGAIRTVLRKVSNLKVVDVAVSLGNIPCAENGNENVYACFKRMNAEYQAKRKAERENPIPTVPEKKKGK